MTKIKNTKKGMAKKTLSMSLVVAMLATSNVPVWAAEFSDGSDVAVTSEADTFSTDAEAPVVEDNAADATEGQATGDTWTVKLTNMPKEVEWGSASTNVTVTVKDVDGKEINYAKPGLKYVWKDAATGLALEEAKDVAATIATPATAFSAKESVGNQYVLYIFDEKGDWSYTSSALTVGAKDISNNTIAYNVNNAIQNTGDRVYTGKETVKNAVVQGINIPFDIDYTGDLVNVGTVKVTAKPIDSKSYKGVVSGSFDITKANVSSDLVKSTLVTKEFPYTGKVIAPAKTDVNVTDKNTNDDLNDIVTSVKSTANVTEVGSTSTITATVKAKDTTKNYVKDSTADIVTADTFKVVARDLSTVKVVVDSQRKKTTGSFTTADFNSSNVHFYDATGKELDLFNSVDITVPANVTNFGTYTLTIKPKTLKKADGTTYTNVTGQTTAQFSIYSEDISGATFSAAIPAQEYTGSQITPDVSKLKVMLNGNEVDPADYSIEYGKNIKAGTDKNGQGFGEIYIVGKRTYEGSKKTVKFIINKATVTDKDLKAAEYVIINKDAKAAKEYAPAIGLVVKAKNGATPAKEFTLTEGTDYTVSYAYQNTTHSKVDNDINNNIIATITLKADGNFTTTAASLTTSTRIASPILKDSDIKMNKTSYEYTGAVIVPDFDVVVDGKTLKRDKDYVIDNVVDSAKVGTATVYITGAGEYDAKVKAKATFEVTPASADKVVVKATSTHTYDGTAHKPKIADITVTLNGNDVKDQFDITSYGENINAGKGTLVLTPNKKNKGFTAGSTKTAEFDIKKATLSGDIKVYDARGIAYTIDKNNKKITKNGQEVSFDYDGTEKTFAKVTFVPTKDASKPDMKVTSDDYEIKYVNNVTGGGTNGASIVVIAKGNYETSTTVADNSTSPATTVKNVAAVANFKINSKLYFTQKEVTVTDAEYAGEGMTAEPTIVVRDGDKVLVKDKDYKVTLNTKVTPHTWKVEGIGDVYGKVVPPVSTTDGMTEGKNYAEGTWNLVKKNVANLDIKVELNAKGETVLTVMNGNLKVDNKDFDVKLSDDKKTATVSAKAGNKHYVGSKEVTVGGEAAKVGAPVISSVKVVGNKATVILSGEADGATGYDYVISKANDTTTARVDVTKNQVKTTGDFNYVQQGTYYAYCHAWTRNAEGKKVFGEWSNIYPFSVSAITPAQPVITSVKAKGTTVTVTYTKAANAEGYDVVLGSAAKKVNGEYRPVEYGKLVKKNIKGNVVTATFKNVKKGTYYAGLHAFNKTSEDGKKVFSQWSNVKKVTVK